MKQAMVHVRCNAVGAIRHEKLNGRDVIIVPSATMPDDIVMNGVRYDAKEIEKSFHTLDRTPAPLGHPTINGKFVSARDPEGINIGWIGAFNTNVRREKGKDGKHRVLVDKVIDVERANQSEGGKRVLAAIEAGEPVHTSTGLLAMLEAVSGDVEHTHDARDIVFDHDAILLDEEGAATPEQGVGMMVNSKGEEIEVINSEIDELDWAVDAAVTAIERRSGNRKSLIERVKTALIEVVTGSERETSTNSKENDMTVSKEQFDALSAEVKTLSESVAKVGDTVAEAVANAVKPLVDAQAEITANQKAKDDAELADLQAKIVKANLMDEDEAKELTLNAARALAKRTEPGSAAVLNGAPANSGDKPKFKLPAGDKE